MVHNEITNSLDVSNLDFQRPNDRIQSTIYTSVARANGLIPLAFTSEVNYPHVHR